MLKSILSVILMAVVCTVYSQNGFQSAIVANDAHTVKQLVKSGQDLNIEKIEKYLQLPDSLHQKYNFSDREQIKLVRPNLYERMLAPLSAGKWLMFVMALTVITDIAILVGIGFGIW